MAFHFYDIVEIYSNADGTQQFIELRTTATGQNFLQGHQIRFTNGDTTNTFTFNHNLLPTTKSTANTTVLIATEGWAGLGLVTPDYIVPNNFLVTTGGTINFGLNADTDTFSILPTTDNLSENRAGTESVYSPTNFAGDSLMFGKNTNNNMSGGAGKDNMSGLGGNDTLNGGVGNDSLNGGSGADSLVGGDGSDVLVGGTGADRLNGGNNNDRLTWDALDAKTDGGANTDTLLLGESLDLTALANTKLLNIEKIDMTGGAPDSVLTLNKSEVLAIGSGNTLTVLGDDGDTVSLTDVWMEGATADGFTTWTRGTAILRVEEGLSVLLPDA
jgi:Ca2+-binding RTX toxin-like protein